MYKPLAILVIVLASTYAHIQPIELYENEEGQLFYMVPADVNQHERVRRGIDYGWGTGGGYVSNTQTLWKNDRNQVDATVYAERELFPKGPLTTGNSATWKHAPTASDLTISTQNTRGRGTDAKVEGTYNFFQTADKKAVFGVSGQVAQHYGHGPPSKPDAAVFVHGKVDLD